VHLDAGTLRSRHYGMQLADLARIQALVTLAPLLFSPAGA
jgi:hypothetical protein